MVLQFKDADTVLMFWDYQRHVEPLLHCIFVTTGTLEEFEVSLFSGRLPPKAWLNSFQALD